jgi:polyisoprenoid-binding protein YceI
MRRVLFAAVLACAASLLAAAPAAAADDYAVDAWHTAVTFKISHLGLSWTYGRFNSVSGNFTIDPADAAGCSFAMEIKTDSIDTGVKARDGHLSSPDFFNVKQYPTISFKSSAVKAIEGGYEVTGDLTLHGVTKSVTFTLKGGKTAQFMGKQRTGFSTEFTVNRSDYDMKKMLEAVGDPVHIAISFEGVKK